MPRAGMQESPEHRRWLPCEWKSSRIAAALPSSAKRSGQCTKAGTNDQAPYWFPRDGGRISQGRQLETLRRTELAHNRNGILVQSIDRVIQVAHVGGREFAGEISEGGAKLREAGESGLANDGDGVVGRKVVTVVGEGDKAEGVDEGVRGIAGDNVDLVIEEGAVDEAEVHHVGLPGEVEAVQTPQGARGIRSRRRRATSAR